ncbi:hypothetical protein BDV93DRAFT_563572 [Ceratobasidium sp. AG-I]|nr:hypothetical protein BDV93DRAFT_563572 [Ceratobasidium sp. AG-I]
MSGAADRLAADLFEAELREQAEDDPRNGWELLWLLGLPLDVRRSYALIQEARIDQDPARRFLRRQSFYQHHNWRQPRSPGGLPCMFIHSTQAQPFASIGRRVQRQKVAPTHITTRTTGHASTRRKFKPKPPLLPQSLFRVVRPVHATRTPAKPPVSTLPRLQPHGLPGRLGPGLVSVGPGAVRFIVPKSAPAGPAAKRPVSAALAAPTVKRSLPAMPAVSASLAHPPAPAKPIVDPNAVPCRPSTPAGLRDAVRTLPFLPIQASGFDPVTLDSRAYSPQVPATPRHYAPSSMHPPGGPPLSVHGKRIPEIFAFLVQAGRHNIAPWQQYSLQEAARDICELQSHQPGVLSGLIKLLFPFGLADMSLAMSPFDSVICDFVRGWAVISTAHHTGAMSEPFQLCSCGGR